MATIPPVLTTTEMLTGNSSNLRQSGSVIGQFHNRKRWFLTCSVKNPYLWFTSKFKYISMFFNSIKSSFVLPHTLNIGLTISYVFLFDRNNFGSCIGIPAHFTVTGANFIFTQKVNFLSSKHVIFWNKNTQLCNTVVYLQAVYRCGYFHIRFLIDYLPTPLIHWVHFVE